MLFPTPNQQCQSTMSRLVHCLETLPQKSALSGRQSARVDSGARPEYHVWGGFSPGHGEREAYNGGLGRSPQRSPGAEPLVRGPSPPAAENFLASRCATEAANLPHSPQFANYVNPRHSWYIFQKTERVVHDGMDNVVYYKKCTKSVNFPYSLTTVTKETQSHSQKSVILVYSIAPCGLGGGVE